ncbi:hypothetical protein J6590_093697, partial [Homalodisca vitripennis]
LPRDAAINLHNFTVHIVRFDFSEPPSNIVGLCSGHHKLSGYLHRHPDHWNVHLIDSS